MPLRAFVFECRSNTYLECIERGVFGSNAPWPLQVARGDYCLLWHYEFATAFALWAAESAGGRRLELRAWGGKFPYQVRVAPVSGKIVEVPKELIAASNHLIEGEGVQRLLDEVR